MSIGQVMTSSRMTLTSHWSFRGYFAQKLHSCWSFCRDFVQRLHSCLELLRDFVHDTTLDREFDMVNAQA